MVGAWAPAIEAGGRHFWQAVAGRCRRWTEHTGNISRGPQVPRSHGKEEARSHVGSADGPSRYPTMKKWIITGGAGFIGCHAAARLHAAGHHVVVVDNLSRRGAELNLAWLRSRGVTDFVWADIRDMHAMHAILDRHSDADAVLHLAAQVAVTTSVADPRTDFEINALGTLNVLEAVRTAAEGRPAVLYSSTNKVYGNLEHVRVVERDGRYAYEDATLGISEDRADRFPLALMAAPRAPPISMSATTPGSTASRRSHFGNRASTERVSSASRTRAGSPGSASRR